MTGRSDRPTESRELADHDFWPDAWLAICKDCNWEREFHVDDLENIHRCEREARAVSSNHAVERDHDVSVARVWEHSRED